MPDQWQDNRYRHKVRKADVFVIWPCDIGRDKRLIELMKTAIVKAVLERHSSTDFVLDPKVADNMLRQHLVLPVQRVWMQWDNTCAPQKQ